MLMLESIKNFPKQFSYEPKIENKKKLKKLDKFVVCGMGGSQLGADMLKSWLPELNIFQHRGYGLPSEKEITKNSLIIASSYSGNTEETIDAFLTAIKKKLPVAVISTGGKLLMLAEKYKTPFIKLPETCIEPRIAVGLSFKALLKICGLEKQLKETALLAKKLDSSSQRKNGEELAKKIKNSVPLIYSSMRNKGIGYYFKISLNETAKMPAFSNALPELNHNEMAGFESQADKFSFILIKDSEDNLRMQKRMMVFEKMFREKNFFVETLEVNGENRLLKIFNAAMLAQWASFYAAKNESAAEKTPIIEQFKNLMSK